MSAGGVIASSLAAGGSQKYVSTSGGSFIQALATVNATPEITATAIISLFEGTPGQGSLINETSMAGSEAATIQDIFVDETSGFTTAIAYANPSTTTGASVSFELFDASANSLGTAPPQVLPATAPHALLLSLSTLFEGTAGLVGTLRITSDIPVVAVALRFSGALNFTALPSFNLDGSVVSGSLTLDSLSPTRVSRGQTLTVNGSGFDSNAASNTVVFNAAMGTVSVSPDTATPTELRVVVPDTAISGPVVVQVTGASTSSVILEVTESFGSSTELVQTTSSVVGGQTTTGVDIYVPVPAGSLNFTSIGVGNRFESISFASSSAQVSQGETTDLVVAGTGISEANGSNVTVSGTGITLSNVSYSGNVIFIQIDVAANASLGPRTVTVTNSNLDTSVLSGGIIIK